MLNLSFDYASCVRASEKVAWRLDDVMPQGTRLDFSRPFLPSALTGPAHPFLSADEQRTLNQINGNAYLNLFAFVEEYILATAVQHAQAEMFGDHHAIRALVRFADEEAKHQALFHRYVAAFRRDAGYEAEVLGSAVEVAGVILSKSPIAVLLVTLHLELMTQAHYVECVKGDDGVDPFFVKLLHMHWLEESQHARIDALELDRLLSMASRPMIEKAFDDYMDLIAAFDGLLGSQAEMDVRTLERAVGRSFSKQETTALVAGQHSGYRRTFLTYGMKNKVFAQHANTIWPEGAARIAAKAEELDG